MSKTWATVLKRRLKSLGRLGQEAYKRLKRRARRLGSGGKGAETAPWHYTYIVVGRGVR